MALTATKSGTGKPARLSVHESEALLNKLNTIPKVELEGDTEEQKALLSGINKLMAVVFPGELERAAALEERLAEDDAAIRKIVANGGGYFEDQYFGPDPIKSELEIPTTKKGNTCTIEGGIRWAAELDIENAEEIEVARAYEEHLGGNIWGIFYVLSDDRLICVTIDCACLYESLDHFYDGEHLAVVEHPAEASK